MVTRWTALRSSPTTTDPADRKYTDQGSYTRTTPRTSSTSSLDPSDRGKVTRAIDEGRSRDLHPADRGKVQRAIDEGTRPKTDRERFEEQRATYGEYTPPPTRERKRRTGGGKKGGGSSGGSGGSSSGAAPAAARGFNLPEIPLNLEHIDALFERERERLEAQRGALMRAFELVSQDLGIQEEEANEEAIESAAGRGRIRSGLFLDRQSRISRDFARARTRAQSEVTANRAPIAQALSTLNARREEAKANRVREVALQQARLAQSLAALGQLDNAQAV